MKNSRSGFSLVEVLISSTFLLIIVAAIFSTIIATQRAHLTESRKTDMNQATRATEQILTDKFRMAGSVLSVLYTPSLLGQNPVFNGIYPLNNNNYADGVILAAGSPYGVTRLTQNFAPGGTMIYVQSTNRASDGLPAWKINDIGMVVRQTGYYVFRVQDLTSNSLTIRSSPVYYSGLLQENGLTNPVAHTYIDNCASGVTGVYLTNTASIVFPLDFFNIILTREESDGSRTLTLTADTEGDANFLDDPLKASVFVPNIDDIQFEYLLKDGSIVSPADNSAFLARLVATVRVHVLFRTTEEKEKSKGTGNFFNKPTMGDHLAEVLPKRNYHYNHLRYEVSLRNFTNVY